MFTDEDFNDMIAPGSKEILVTPKMITETQRLAGLGLTVVDIAAYFGFTDRTWHKKANEHPELRTAFKRGKAKQISEVAGELFRQIQEGSTQATIFYLKTQAGWKEPDDAKPSQVYLEDDEKVIDELDITTNDPTEAARAYQQFMLRGKNERDSNSK